MLGTGHLELYLRTSYSWTKSMFCDPSCEIIIKVREPVESTLLRPTWEPWSPTSSKEAFNKDPMCSLCLPCKAVLTIAPSSTWHQAPGQEHELPLPTKPQGGLGGSYLYYSWVRTILINPVVPLKGLIGLA